MSVPSWSACAKILAPNIIIFEGKTFGEWLGHDGKALMYEISDFIKQTPESSLTPSNIWGDRR